MELQQEIDYNRIAEAIEYFRLNFKSQPSLEQAAEQVNLSPFHFQRMFRQWAGVTPKQFLQYLSVEHVGVQRSKHGAIVTATSKSHFTCLNQGKEGPEVLGETNLCATMRSSYLMHVARRAVRLRPSTKHALASRDPLK